MESASPYDVTRAKKEMVEPSAKDATVALHERSPWIERFALAFHRTASLAPAILRPRLVILGCILPIALVMPVASVFRAILEHAATNPRNPFIRAAFHKTGPSTRFLLFRDAGDCHRVRRIFPDIPFHRMGRAVGLFRPFHVGKGVRERRSILPPLRGFFIRTEPRRALWSV